MPVFLTLFLAPVYVPLHLLSGWIHGVASVNPATALLDSGRNLIAGQPGPVGAAAAIACGLIAVLAVWSLRSLRRAEAEGG
jgi:ABC-2 type transport system permease protein